MNSVQQGNNLVLVSDLYGVNVLRSEPQMHNDFEHISGKSAEVVASAIKAAGRDALKIGTKSPELYVENLNRLLETVLSVDDVRQIWNLSLRADNAMIEMLHGLKQNGVPVVLLSNLNWFDWQDAKELGLAGFDAVLTYEVGIKKPNPAIWQLALDKNPSIPAENHFFIDDQLKNVEAARRLGMGGAQFFSYEELLPELRDFGFPV